MRTRTFLVVALGIMRRNAFDVELSNEARRILRRGCFEAIVNFYAHAKIPSKLYCMLAFVLDNVKSMNLITPNEIKYDNKARLR